MHKKFAYVKKKQYLCTRNRKRYCLTLRRSKHISNAGVRLKRIDRRKTHSEGARSKREVSNSDFGTPLFCIN